MSVVRNSSFGRFLMAMMVALSCGDWAVGGDCPGGVCGVPRSGFSSVRSARPMSGGCPGGVCGVPNYNFSSVRSSAPLSGGCPGGVCGVPAPNFSPVSSPASSESAPVAGVPSGDSMNSISQSVAAEFNAGLSSLNPQYATIVSGQVGEGGAGALRQNPTRTVAANVGASGGAAAPTPQQTFRNSNSVIDSQLNQMAKNGTLRDGMVVNDPVMRMGSSVVNNKDKFVQVGEGVFMRKADGAFFAEEAGKDRYQPVVGVGEGKYEGAADALTPSQKEFFEKLAKLQTDMKPDELEKILNEGEGAVAKAMSEQEKEEEKTAEASGERLDNKEEEAYEAVKKWVNEPPSVGGITHIR